jgi:hypothetical protein
MHTVGGMHDAAGPVLAAKGKKKERQIEDKLKRNNPFILDYKY